MNAKTKRDLALLAGLLWLFWFREETTVTISYGPEVGGTDTLPIGLPGSVGTLPAPPPDEPGSYPGQLRMVSGTMYEWNGYGWVAIAQGTVYDAAGGPSEPSGGGSNYAVLPL